MILSRRHNQIEKSSDLNIVSVLGVITSTSPAEAANLEAANGETNNWSYGGKPVKSTDGSFGPGVSFRSFTAQAPAETTTFQFAAPVPAGTTFGVFSSPHSTDSGLNSGSSERLNSGSSVRLNTGEVTVNGTRMQPIGLTQLLANEGGVRQGYHQNIYVPPSAGGMFVPPSEGMFSTETKEGYNYSGTSPVNSPRYGTSPVNSPRYGNSPVNSPRYGSQDNSLNGSQDSLFDDGVLRAKSRTASSGSIASTVGAHSPTHSPNGSRTSLNFIKRCQSNGSSLNSSRESITSRPPLVGQSNILEVTSRTPLVGQSNLLRENPIKEPGMIRRLITRWKNRNNKSPKTAYRNAPGYRKPSKIKRFFRWFLPCVKADSLQDQQFLD